MQDLEWRRNPRAETSRGLKRCQNPLLGRASFRRVERPLRQVGAAAHRIEAAVYLANLKVVVDAEEAAVNPYEERAAALDAGLGAADAGIAQASADRVHDIGAHPFKDVDVAMALRRGPPEHEGLPHAEAGCEADCHGADDERLGVLPDFDVVSRGARAVASDEHAAASDQADDAGHAASPSLAASAASAASISRRAAWTSRTKAQAWIRSRRAEVDSGS